MLVVAFLDRQDILGKGFLGGQETVDRNLGQRLEDVVDCSLKVITNVVK